MPQTSPPPHHHNPQPSTPTAITHPPTPASTHLPTHHHIAQCKLQCPMKEQQCSSMTLRPIPSARATMQLNDIASNAQCQSHNAHQCHCTQCPMPNAQCHYCTLSNALPAHLPLQPNNPSQCNPLSKFNFSTHCHCPIILHCNVVYMGSNFTLASHCTLHSLSHHCFRMVTGQD